MLGRETGNYGGRVALVTGGARGIGAAICTALARSGHHVAVNFHSREDAANTLVAAIKREGGTAIAIAGDVANAGSVERMVQYVEQAIGPVTILVNNAAAAAGVAGIQTVNASR